MVEVVEDRGQTGEGARVVVGALDQQRDGLVVHGLPIRGNGIGGSTNGTGRNLLAVSFGSFADLSNKTVKPAGWTWRPTGEQFADWWSRQDTEGRNVWLRSMGIRLTWKNNGSVAWNLETGYMERFEEHLRFGKSAAEVVRWLQEGN